jgi:hypothetical protein
VLPKGVEGFTLVDGVWVTTPKLAGALAMVLRQSLVDLSGARLAAEGQQSKAEVMYQYLTGPRFQQRVNAILEPFLAMQEDLQRERRSMERVWNMRAVEIDRVIKATSGMYGDLQGIAGQSMKELEALNLDASANDEAGPVVRQTTESGQRHEASIGEHVEY